MEDNIAFNALVSKYLNWCKVHRAPRSVEWYMGHLRNFMDHLGESADIPALNLKPYHVSDWVDSKSTWGPTYKGGAIVAVKRVYNWAEEQGYLDVNPIKKLKKPTAKRRESYMTPSDMEIFLSHVAEGDPFRDLLLFAWNTGSRPQEARNIEPRHVSLENRRIKFPAIESKGKRYPRRILLNDTAMGIADRLMRKNKGGTLFKNSRGDAWSKYAICNRMARLSKKTGIPRSMYDCRHGMITLMLKNGVDVVTAAAISGHRNGTMIATVYSHVDDDEEYLLKALPV